MNDLSANIIVIQALGFVAFALGMYAFSQRDDRRLKIFQAGQSLTLALHFYLLGSNGAVVASSLSAVRNIAALYGKAKPFAPLFLLAYAGLGFYSYERWADILPILAVLASTTGIFYLQKIPMRFCILFATSMWIIHNAVLLSIGPLCMEIFMFAANALTIRSLYRERQAGTHA